MAIRLTLAIFIILLIIVFFSLDLGQYVTLEQIKTGQGEWRVYYKDNRLLIIALFFITYTLSAALSLPIATFLTLLSGAIFGFGLGLLIASFASSLGALIAFLITRYIFKDFVHKRYAKVLSQVNEAFVKEGLWYLLTMRLVPLFPFFLVNVMMALLPIKALWFYLISQVGMLAGTAVYVYAGLSLASINNISDIFSTQLLIAFTLIGILPLLAQKVVMMIKAKSL